MRLSSHLLVLFIVALVHIAIYMAIVTRLLESNVTQLNIRSPDAEKMK